MTMAARLGASYKTRVASDIAKLRALVAELRRQTEASVEGLHTIRARTSNVLAATTAFSTLATEIAALGRRLSAPLPGDLDNIASERAAFHQELHLLIDQLDTYRQRYGAELAMTVQRKPKPKKRWWHVFK